MASANVVVITEANFQEQVLNSPVPVLVDFWAQWCGPCRMLGPLVDELADEYHGKAKVGKVDIDASQQLAMEYKITAVPTLLVFKGGQVHDVLVGLKSKRDLKSSLDKAIAG
jgi:thioredoxin 1